MQPRGACTTGDNARGSTSFSLPFYVQSLEGRRHQGFFACFNEPPSDNRGNMIAPRKGPAMKLSLILCTVGAVVLGGFCTARADSPTTAPAVAPNQPLTMDDLKAQFQAQKYRDLLQQISKLQSNKKAMSNFNAYDLDLLKAETYLRLRMNVQAIDTLTLAGRDAPDPIAKATAAATAMLIKRSSNLIYTPRHQVQANPADTAKPKATYDLSNMEQRPDALTALFNDERVELVPRLIGAEKSAALPPIAAVAKPLADLSTLELAATGKDGFVTQERNTLASRAADLMQATLDQMAARVTTIRTNAEKIVSMDLPVVQNGKVVATQKQYGKRGLGQGDGDTLRAIKTNADKIDPAAHELADRLQTKPTDFSKVIAAARQLSIDADKVLNTDYTGLSPTPR
jgi:hypothetical protein